jgi:hypothetical protein
MTKSVDLKGIYPRIPFDGKEKVPFFVIAWYAG